MSSVAMKHTMQPREEFYDLVGGARRARQARRARRPETAFYCCALYTNMSGVTPSPPFSRLVLDLLEGILLFGCDRCHPAPSALHLARGGPRRCSVPPTCEYPILCPLSQGTRTDIGAQGSVNKPLSDGGNGAIQLRDFC